MARLFGTLEVPIKFFAALLAWPAKDGLLVQNQAAFSVTARCDS